VEHNVDFNLLAQKILTSAAVSNTAAIAKIHRPETIPTFSALLQGPSVASFH
jgi:hypothetical protein